MSSSLKAGKSRKQKKVQTRIAFAPADEPSPAAEKSSPSPARIVYESSERSSIRPPASSSTRSTSSRASFTPRKSQAQISFTSVAHANRDSDVDDDGIPEGKKFAVVIRTQAANVSSPAKSVSSNTSTKKSKPATFMPKAPKSKSKLHKVISVESSDDDNAESEDESEERLKKTPKPAKTYQPIEEESEDEDEEPILSQTPRLAGRRKPSYLTDSDEEPLTKPPKAVVRADGRVEIGRAHV